MNPAGVAQDAYPADPIFLVYRAKTIGLPGFAHSLPERATKVGIMGKKASPRVLA